MITTTTTLRALHIASTSHKGKVDTKGEPYVVHLMKMAEMMDDEESTCAALLSDALETRSVSEEEIRESFGNDVADAVLVLAHRDSETRDEYLTRVCLNELATKVGKADLVATGTEISEMNKTALDMVDSLLPSARGM